MKRKILKTLALCISFLSVLICFLSRGSFVRAETSNRITLESNQEVTKGSTYYAYVYIDSLENIASLSISVHYDSQVMTINNTYNQVSCSLYDNSIANDAISYSYIFNNDGQNSKTSLFYFGFTILNNTSISESYFDITIDEAYDFNLEVTSVSGSRKYFSINDQQPATKYCYVYGTSSISTKKEEEFEITYRFDTPNIASGTVEIQYDRDLFEFVSLTQLGFLTGKMVDVNSTLEGAVSISFLGTEYSNNTNFVGVKFKTIANLDTSSSIRFVASSFYDLDLANISCNGCATHISLSYDSSFDDSLPQMYLTSNYDSANNQVVVNTNLTANSHLGAGDFTISWNTNNLTYNSFTKRFNPSFFNVNDKLVANGVLKFSIISMSDIVDENRIIEIVFDAINLHDEASASIELSGSGLSDSLTNPISLNLINCNQSIPGRCTYGEWITTIEPTCTEAGSEHRICSVCGHEDVREIMALGHDWSDEWTIDVEATCEHTGSKSHHCTNCDEKKDETEIEKTDHIGSSAVIENMVAATCTAAGSYDEVVYCKDCHTEMSREHKVIEALGHTYGEWITTIEPTCTEAGSEHRICSVCGHEEVREIDKLDSSSLFIETLNSIDLSEESLESLYNKLALCNEYYQYIENKNFVADYYENYQNLLAYYQNVVESINSEYDTARIIEKKYFIAAVSTISLLSIVSCIFLKGKRWFL